VARHLGAIKHRGGDGRSGSTGARGNFTAGLRWVRCRGGESMAAMAGWERARVADAGHRNLGEAAMHEQEVAYMVNLGDHL